MPNDPAASAKRISARPQPGLLLIEEYGALAVAIKSALRKFAPRHEIQVAAGFATATELAVHIQPELFVVDLDPPPNGAIAFLLKLQAEYPTSRILVLAAGTSEKFCAARGKSAAIQFVEKPFDLPELGAAVQALIGSRDGQDRSAYGTASDLSFLDLAQVMSACLSSAVLRVTMPDGRLGEVHFKRGQIIHAATAAQKGVFALEEIANWTAVRLSQAELPEQLRRTIDGTLADVLLPIVRRIAERAEQKPTEISPTQPAPAPAKTGKKIVVIDDTELLLVFVTDTLSTFNPNLQIVTATTGADGLQLVETLRPDLILLDYSLTDITGDQICRKLLEDESTARIPVLMMSGHFTELMRTAEDYRNVIDALPKPFFSGTLINAVQRALASGLLPEIAPPPSTTTSAAPAIPPQPATKSAPETSSGSTSSSAVIDKPAGASTPSIPESSTPPSEAQRPPLPNGNEPQSEGPSSTPPPATSSLGEKTSFGAVIETPVAVSAEATPASRTQTAPSTMIGTSVMTPPPPSKPRREQIGATPHRDESAAKFAKQTELSVTFSLEVAVVQLSPILQVERVRLRPISRSVAVQMKGPEELRAAGFDLGFELGPFQLGANGQVETLRLILTRESIELPANANSFHIGEINLQLANSHYNLELVAAQNFSMPVQLTAAFELVRVEFSPAFELQAIFLRLRELEVVLRNSGESDGARLELQEVEIDSSGELRAFVVRSFA